MSMDNVVPMPGLTVEQCVADLISEEVPQEFSEGVVRILLDLAEMAKHGELTSLYGVATRANGEVFEVKCEGHSNLLEIIGGLEAIKWQIQARAYQP